MLLPELHLRRVSVGIGPRGGGGRKGADALTTLFCSSHTRCHSLTPRSVCAQCPQWCVAMRFFPCCTIFEGRHAVAQKYHIEESNFTSCLISFLLPCCSYYQVMAETILARPPARSS